MLPGKSMIEQLLVKDYVLFPREEVDLSGDMTVITGETGAGKSLLIDAIGYLCGNRLNGNVVRPGADKALLQMILSEPSEEAKKLLEENGFDVEDEILISRTIFPTGKSRIQVNGQNTTNAFAKKLTDTFIDIHSQMDTMKLTDPEIQREMVDLYAGNESLQQRVRQSFSQFQKVRQELAKLQKETFSDDELERLTAALNEIEQSNIQNGELEELSSKIKEASNVQRNLDDYDQILDLLKRDGGLLDQAAALHKILRKNRSMEALSDESFDLYDRYQVLRDEISAKRESIEELANELDTLMERQYKIKQLYKKYGGSYESVVHTQKKIEERISRILNRQEIFDQLKKKLAQAQKEYMDAAKALSASRKEQFQELQEQIEQHAQELMLEHIRFEIRSQEKKPSSNGMDEIEFVASMNPGQPLTPLKQAGSGGELSRLMLALKTVFQARNGITTLIFDEIDTGVSGKVALAMGSKMNRLAKNYQVLSITHLASVAVWADHHLRVNKKTDGERTFTAVESLEGEDHFEELAIMSSGSAQPQSVQSMKELARSLQHG